MINCFFQGVNLMINSVLKHKLMSKNIIKCEGSSLGNCGKSLRRSENSSSFDRYRAFDNEMKIN